MSVEIIAEVASNHGGSIPLAKEFIARCADAGADWVKFQTTRVKHLRPDDPQYAWFQQVELSDDAHWELKAACEGAGVKMLTTVYHHADVPFVASLGLAAIKIGSGEAHEEALAEAVLAVPATLVYVSDGIRPCAAQYLTTRRRVRRLRCTARYPAPPIPLSTPFGDRTLQHDGWSAHSVGIAMCDAAILLGA